MQTVAPVNKIIPFSSVDGFGNRTAIFFQGCNQNCLYCHNPETIQMCKNCGACINTCPAGALTMKEGHVIYNIEKCCNCDTCLRTCKFNSSPRIRYMTPQNLFEEVKQYFPFVDGITTSGGECGLYPEFLEEFYSLVKAAGKTTYMDTNGQVSLWDKKGLLRVLDQAMVDLKAGTEPDHNKLTGLGVDTPIKNIQVLAKEEKLYEIRTVVVPGVVDNQKTVEVGSGLIAAYPKVRYKLIKFRRYGVRDNFSDTREPKDTEMEMLKQKAESFGVQKVIIT